MPPLLDVNNLTTRFHTRDGIVRAVENVSFSVEEGQALGIVGESGSGKSVTCYSLLGLIPQPPGKIHAGKATFQGRDLLKLKEAELRKLRGAEISMIFQDPMTSLNPYTTVGNQVAEPLIIHQGLSKKEAYHKALDALEQVGIRDASQRAKSYPHEFSGGMRQRVMIAMALITKPKLLICDEPTTALDVTIQKQVLDLISSLQNELGTSVIMITHDLGVVSQVCDQIAVMYAGRIVEQTATNQLLTVPKHAYTRALLKSMPATRKKGDLLFTIPGTPPDLTKTNDCCAFKERNTLGDPSRCLTEDPPQLEELYSGHYVQNCPGCLEE